MKRMVGFVKATLIGGLVFIVPLVIVGVLIREAALTTTTVIRPVARWLPIEEAVGAVLADVLAAAAIVSVCFTVGLFVSTRFGQMLNERLEQVALRRVPGFTALKALTRGMVGLETDSELAVALAWIEDAWMLAFVVERHQSGWRTVFVPSAPTPAAGAVYFLPEDRIKLLDVPVSAAVACVARLGVGSRELLANVSLAPVSQPTHRA